MIIRHHLASLTIAFAVTMMATSVQAHDGSIRGVVEFFTSQGCNACPPADAVLSSLTKENDVIALGYHVDYWNYRGWKDTFSQHENTVLQAGYMKAFGKRALFTPQAVINGQVGVNGSDIMAIRSQLVATSQQSSLVSGLPLKIEVGNKGSRIVVKLVSTQTEIPADAKLFAIRVEPERKVLIESGENKGRMITYHNIVRERQLQHAKLVRGAAISIDRRSLRNGEPGQSEWVFVVQRVTADGLPGQILGAGRL
ncbi:hypothetical protein GCM10010136_23280 [Limoniibacter endophyticus]|uniref:DUF1223 domain-containing protein n=2 Tax=Limoniibacter endophyticus TaxID=1565040 RepID=A0A8J3GGQ3_9HYPH|nr:hypothetical protein GCM10010136_23280 [Limoniibacter endophyticus]